MDNTQSENLKGDDLLLHLEKNLIYLLPLNYLNHPFLITNTDGSITKLNYENNKFLEIEDQLKTETEPPKENETLKSNCFLTIYTTLSDIKMDGEEENDKKKSIDSSNPSSSSSAAAATIPHHKNPSYENSLMRDLFKDPKQMIKEAKDWVSQFINYYIYVLNWVKYEKLFKKHPEVNDRILARILAFAYSILDNIANPDLNPAFQNFYLLENSTNSNNLSNTTTNNNNTNSSSSSSSSSNDNSTSSYSNSMEEESKITFYQYESNIMEVSPSVLSDNSSNRKDHENTLLSMPSTSSSSSSSSSSSNMSTPSSNHYPNSIPLLPSNKTSIINFYSPKLKNKILLITKLIRILSRYGKPFFFFLFFFFFF